MTADTAAQHLAVHYGALGQWQAIRDDPEVYRHALAYVEGRGVDVAEVRRVLGERHGSTR